ncbi:uncharacterized protein J3D65DRAFT_689129 [Phyllosticta citribraziliensis]|uniref:Uncharacterized protein n=1 Tax=Phyllosticta citribraziliensis TaxID=989973 RepID=A0ABR1L724_9PEZI
MSRERNLKKSNLPYDEEFKTRCAERARLTEENSNEQHCRDVAANDRLIQTSPPQDMDPELKEALISLDPEEPEKLKEILGRFATKFKPLRDHLVEDREKDMIFEDKLRGFNHEEKLLQLLDLSRELGLFPDLEKVVSALRDQTSEADGPGHEYGNNEPGKKYGEGEPGDEVGENGPGNRHGEQDPENQIEENEPGYGHEQAKPVVEGAVEVLPSPSVGDSDCDSDWEIVEITKIVHRRRRGKK